MNNNNFKKDKVKVVNFNLQKAYSRLILSPVLKNSDKILPFFLTKDKINADDDGNLEAIKTLRAEAGLKNAAEKNLNSPTNIRRIWIGASTVAVEYYEGYKLNGKTENLVMIKRKVSIDGNTFDNMIRSWYESGGQSVKFTGDILSPAGGWVFNNLEEIYFDFSVFMSDSAVKMLGVSQKEMTDMRIKWVKEYFGQTTPLNEQGAGTTYEAIVRKLFLGMNRTEIRKTMVRLHTICFYSKLDELLKNDNFESTVSKFDLKNVKRMSEKWKDHKLMKQAMDTLGGDLWYHCPNQVPSNINFSKNGKAIDDGLFKVKDNIFIFDDYLKKKILAYSEKYNKMQAESRQAKQAELVQGPEVKAGSIDERLYRLKENLMGEPYNTEESLAMDRTKALFRYACAEMKRVYGNTQMKKALSTMDDYNVWF